MAPLTALTPALRAFVFTVFPPSISSLVGSWVGQMADMLPTSKIKDESPGAQQFHFHPLPNGELYREKSLGPSGHLTRL